VVNDTILLEPLSLESDLIRQGVKLFFRVGEHVTCLMVTASRPPTTPKEIIDVNHFSHPKQR
jgi:hypothetical protein